ncbi:MAG: hypothetical protein LBC76_03440 [Treponema sp.]|jgi:hypothetical protein|nr:hypothetical protein [Treponema sp.]
MKELKIIPPEVAVLIPRMQLEFTKENLEDFSDAILRLQAQLEKCPKIKETDGMKEHPAIFHYFYDITDIFICEYDGINKMFGFAILGDLEMSEWGYFSLSELTGIAPLNIDYYFSEQSIEVALYTKYPKYYKRPKSLSPLNVFIKNLKKRIKRWLKEKRNEETIKPKEPDKTDEPKVIDSSDDDVQGELF